jgi:hypothetical protein
MAHIIGERWQWHTISEELFLFLSDIFGFSLSLSLSGHRRWDEII